MHVRAPVGGSAAAGSQDSPACLAALEALQKLSLRRRAQSDMIALGMVEWLSGYLQVRRGGWGGGGTTCIGRVHVHACSGAVLLNCLGHCVHISG